MLVINKIDELRAEISEIKKSGKRIGFVPTMGALHAGHLSLLQQAKRGNDVVVCSIFVNPTQFNNLNDLAKYPRDLAKDLAFIDGVADLVFAPSEAEVYPTPPTESYDFGALERVMEGSQRPGHFNGVGIIVKRLFDWVEPDSAYFGEKDYQQLLIINELVRQKGLSVEIVPCPIVREKSGLAISSRNQRLTAEQKDIAANIYRILQLAKTMENANSVREIEQFVAAEIGKVAGLELEYFEIVDARTLQPIGDLERAAIGCVAVYCGGVRLIDNIKLQRNKTEQCK